MFLQVRRTEDGKFVGLPDEWLQVLLSQVDEDKKAGDEGAADAGWRVLRFFQEFWPSSYYKPVSSPSLPASSSVFYLELNNGSENDRVPPVPHPPTAKPPGVPRKPSSSSSASTTSTDDSSSADFIELTDAQQAMAETILGLRKKFGEASAARTPSLRAAAAVQSQTNEVKLRQDDGQSGVGVRATARYRDISVYTSGQALDEMRRLCNAKPMEEVYSLGAKLGSGSGGTVLKATNKTNGDTRAIKTIDLAGGEKKRHLLMEVLVMRELKHKNLVGFTDIFLTPR